MTTLQEALADAGLTASPARREPEPLPTAKATIYVRSHTTGGRCFDCKNTSTVAIAAAGRPTRYACRRCATDVLRFARRVGATTDIRLAQSRIVGAPTLAAGTPQVRSVKVTR